MRFAESLQRWLLIMTYPLFHCGSENRKNLCSEALDEKAAGSIMNLTAKGNEKTEKVSHLPVLAFSFNSDTFV